MRSGLAGRRPEKVPETFRDVDLYTDDNIKTGLTLLLLSCVHYPMEANHQ